MDTRLTYLDSAIGVARGYGIHLLLTGDFNVHNADWLGSQKTTAAGESLEELAVLHHLNQLVYEPTRGSI